MHLWQEGSGYQALPWGIRREGGHSQAPVCAAHDAVRRWGGWRETREKERRCCEKAVGLRVRPGFPSIEDFLRCFHNT